MATLSTMPSRLKDVFLRTWFLGFTSFGGPVVHFQIFHKKFVDSRDPWLDEQTYQEIFAICQALPGPGSTKMGFSIALLRGGLIPACLAFLTWSLPGALGMYALSIGVSHVSDILPLPVYGLLSGLNASVVGVIAFAAVQLATKAITDPLSRLIVVFSACAGLCYHALWYFPLLVIAGGICTLMWDMWARGFVGRIIGKRRSRDGEETVVNAPANQDSVVERRVSHGELSDDNIFRRREGVSDIALEEIDRSTSGGSDRPVPASIDRVAHDFSVKTGLAIIVAFFTSFITIMVVNAVLNRPPLELRLFRNMYLAGTIIFGGGPVVIPLLREYVVQPGFVSSRDFLIGLAIIQAFPGPNFNFAVYLGALTLSPTSTPSIVGAILGFFGIFLPGLTLQLGFHSVWRVVRSNAFVIALLRGVNAAAVGLVFTAVYRLWEIGYLTPERNGFSLGDEPWWVVVAVVTYTSTAWFGVETWIAIVGGAVLGLCWYGVVRPW